MMQQGAALHIRIKIFFALIRSRLPVKGILLLIVPLHFLLQHSFAQAVNDTIYYDHYWRICEKPISRFYRVSKLQMEPQWHFINDVKDFYIEGSPEMTGHYSSTGRKTGAFTFYHPNGKLKKTGAFVNDTMKGTWSFYDVNGGLYFQIDCENNHSFTPLVIINPGGDTLLKNGTGHFAFKLLDYPDVFPDARDCLVKGECLQGKKVGEWAYDLFYDNGWHPAAKENYEAGIFESGRQFHPVVGESELSEPAIVSDLSVHKLAQTEAFVPDPVFGDFAPDTHAEQLKAFLLRGEAPVFASQAKKFDANVLDYLPLCAASIGYASASNPKLAWIFGGAGFTKFNQGPWLVAYCIQTNNGEITKQSDLFPVEKLKAYNAQINFTLYEDGTTSDVAVKGNFDKDVMVHIAYYLSRLTGLAPLRQNGKPVSTKQNLFLFTKVNKATYRKHNYIVYRLLLSQKPQEQTEDKFDIADFAKAGSEDEAQ